jgi:hypothetical protein
MAAEREREDTSAFDTVLEHSWSKLISLQATMDFSDSASSAPDLTKSTARSPSGTKPRCAAVQQVVGYWKCCGPSAPLGRTAALDPLRSYAVRNFCGAK